MNLASLRTAPWAITPNMFGEVQGIYERHMRGEVFDREALEARLGRPINNAPPGMEVTPDGTAIITIGGVLMKRANMFTDVSGATSTNVVSAQLATALADPMVKAIALVADSPGGTVDGTQQLAAMIYAARGQKPITAWVDGMCCSAAYWIASACDKVMLSGPTAQVGSIGIIATHVDQTAADAAQGLKYTEVTSGPRKAAQSPHKPLGNVGLAAMQDTVDSLHAMFAGDVAKGRGLSADALKGVADGRVLLGSAAIAAGLADGFASLDSVLASLAGRAQAGLSAKAPRSATEIRAAAEAMVAQHRAVGRHLSLAYALAMVASGSVPSDK